MLCMLALVNAVGETIKTIPKAKTNVLLKKFD